jgi:hypothetical protein
MRFHIGHIFSFRFFFCFTSFVLGAALFLFFFCLLKVSLTDMVIYSDQLMFVRDQVGQIVYCRSTKWKDVTSSLALSVILHLSIVQSIVNYVCSSSGRVELKSVTLFAITTVVWTSVRTFGTMPNTLDQSSVFEVHIVYLVLCILLPIDRLFCAFSLDLYQLVSAFSLLYLAQTIHVNRQSILLLPI